MAKALCKYCGKSWAEKKLLHGVICPWCVETQANLPKPEPKRTATIYQNKRYSKWGWYWKEGWNEGFTFTKRGAVRQAKRNAKKKKLGISNSFEVEV